MTEVGTYEAKTHLAQILERVAKGERVLITKHGVPVALLSPVGPQADPHQVVEQLRAFRRGKTLKPIRVRDLIEEGRDGA